METEKNYVNDECLGQLRDGDTLAEPFRALTTLTTLTLLTRLTNSLRNALWHIILYVRAILKEA